MGAAIGPGSESQHLQVHRYHPDGRWGVAFTRVVFDNDAYYRGFAGTRAHEVDFTGALHYARWVGPLLVGATIDLTRTFNRWYVPRNDLTSVNLAFEGRWGW